ncbi:MAG: phosphotransferase [Aestuariivirga sp.]|nr:phosphotransferase [Aestuariivirga sp.]
MLTETQEIARRAAGPDWKDATVEPAIPVLASPSWRGVDADLWRLVSADGTTLIAKVMDPDTSAFSDLATSFTAARQAAEAGIGPKVLAADVASRTLVMEDLSELRGWSAGTLDKVLDRAVRLKVLEARKAFHRTKPLGRKIDLFAEVERLLNKCRTAGAPLPEDIGWLAMNMRELRDAIGASGIDYVPAHGDGNVSNLMFSDKGEVRLIDWDMAGDMDPLLDVGAFLVEAHDSESDAAECFEAYHGRFDRALFNRAWLYGVADDVRWGLIGALLAGTSRRETYEFLKFGDWRFLRARMAIRDPRFSEKLGRL